MKDVYYRVYALFFVNIFFPFFIEAICHQPSSLETHVPFCRRNRRYKNKIITNMMTMNTNKRKYIAAPIPMQSNCVWIMIQLVTNVNVYEFFFVESQLCLVAAAAAATKVCIAYSFMFECVCEMCCLYSWRIHWRSLVSEWTNQANQHTFESFCWLLIHSQAYVTHKPTYTLPTYTWHYMRTQRENITYGNK